MNWQIWTTIGISNLFYPPSNAAFSLFLQICLLVFRWVVLCTQFNFLFRLQPAVVLSCTSELTPLAHLVVSLNLITVSHHTLFNGAQFTFHVLRFTANLTFVVSTAHLTSGPAARAGLALVWLQFGWQSACAFLCVPTLVYALLCRLAPHFEPAPAQRPQAAALVARTLAHTGLGGPALAATLLLMCIWWANLTDLTEGHTLAYATHTHINLRAHIRVYARTHTHTYKFTFIYSFTFLYKIQYVLRKILKHFGMLTSV